MACSKKFIPGSEDPAEEIFTYPYFINEESKQFIHTHGRIMFIIRGPPGTGKNSLAALMISHFPSSIKCSADDYFNSTYRSNSSVPNKQSLSDSHLYYCHSRVKKECTKSSHPVIVSNTHMRKKEMQNYLNMAEEYGYTVIITSTLDKFKVSPEILAKSNTKGLDKKYFKKRLATWENVFPIFMGWFLCPDDASYILHHLQYALDALLGDGKFCRVFNVFDKDTLLSNYKAKTLLSCMAGFMKGSPFELKCYYQSPEIRDSYGKCFEISIEAFLITKSNIFAIVQLNDHLMNLTFKPNFENISNSEEEKNDSDNIVVKMRHMSVNKCYNFKFTPLLSDFSKKPKTAVLNERIDNSLNISKISFIHLAQNDEKMFSMCELNEFFRKEFIGVNGESFADQFNVLENEYSAYRLNDDSWIIQSPKILSFKTVFTGLYI